MILLFAGHPSQGPLLVTIQPSGMSGQQQRAHSTTSPACLVLQSADLGGKGLAPLRYNLCYAMLCYAMLCYAMLCYAMLAVQQREQSSSTRARSLQQCVVWADAWSAFISHVRIHVPSENQAQQALFAKSRAASQCMLLLLPSIVCP